MSAQTRFILKNVIRAITLLFAVSVITFALATMAPIDPVEAYAGSENHLPQEQLDQIAAKWGFDLPPHQRYLNWISGVLTGDWGVSVIYHRPVLDVVGERFLTSLALMGTAWILSGVLGFVLGIVCGLRQNSWADRIIKGFCLVLAAAPTFWLALLALMAFSVFLGWFPTGLAAPAGMRAEDVTLAMRLHHLFLPALVLSVTGIAQITLQTREKTIEARLSDYALFAHARGETESQFTRRHVLRNIALPAITLSVLGVANIALHTREKAIDVMESDYIRFAMARGLTPWQALRYHGLRNLLGCRAIGCRRRSLAAALVHGHGFDIGSTPSGNQYI